MPCIVIFLVLLFPSLVQCNFPGNCYKNWDVWWGSNVSPNSTIKLCPINATITFRWRDSLHGAWQLFSPECPDNFTEGITGKELFPISNWASATVPDVWTLPSTPGYYYATSQAPGDCQNGNLISVQVVGSASQLKIHWFTILAQCAVLYMYIVL